jgi:hypothetical protein
MGCLARYSRRAPLLYRLAGCGPAPEETDVDLLVIMRTKNAIDQSIRIKTAFERMFSLDLIVRTPWQFERGLKRRARFFMKRETAQWARQAARNDEIFPLAHRDRFVILQVIWHTILSSGGCLMFGMGIEKVIEAGHRAAKVGGTMLDQVPDIPDGEPGAEEWKAFKREVGRLIKDGQAGKFAVFKGDRLVGVWDSPGEAVLVNFERFGDEPFLLQEIQLYVRPMRWGYRQPCPE